jgi:hypothetical protein
MSTHGPLFPKTVVEIESTNNNKTNNYISFQMIKKKSQPMSMEIQYIKWVIVVNSSDQKEDQVSYWPDDNDVFFELNRYTRA